MAECQTRCLALEPLQAQSVTEGHQQIHALLGDPGPLVARRPPAVRGRLAATNPRELAVGAVRELDVIDVGGPALSRSRRVHGSGPHSSASQVSGPAWSASSTAHIMKLRTFIVVHRRRDVQGEFTGEVVPTDVLRRILDAAHTAPSVGLSQPWDFVLIRDVDTRTAFRDHVQAEREISTSQLDNEQFRTLRHRRCRLVLSVLGHREPVVGRDRRGARGRVGQLLPGGVPAGTAGHPQPAPAGCLAVPGHGQDPADHPGPRTPRLATPYPAGPGRARGAVRTASTPLSPHRGSGSDGAATGCLADDAGRRAVEAGHAPSVSAYVADAVSAKQQRQQALDELARVLGGPPHTRCVRCR